jgi:hypothetical protein
MGGEGVEGEGRGVVCGRVGAKDLRGARGIRGHHAGSAGAARGPGRWAMHGLSSRGLEVEGLFNYPNYHPGLVGNARAAVRTRGATQGDTGRVPGGLK